MSALAILARAIAGQARAFLGERKGSTVIEYAVIAALLSAAIVSCIGTLSGSLAPLFAQIAGSLNVK